MPGIIISMLLVSSILFLPTTGLTPDAALVISGAQSCFREALRDSQEHLFAQEELARHSQATQNSSFRNPYKVA